MKLGERLCAALCIINMFIAGFSGLSVYLMVMKKIEGASFVCGIFVISIILFLGFFFYGMRYYGE